MELLSRLCPTCQMRNGIRREEARRGKATAQEERRSIKFRNASSLNSFFVSSKKHSKTMRNKKSKGDGGAAAAANATTSPSGASNTSCFLQVREREQTEKKERENRFFPLPDEGHRKKTSRRGLRFTLDSVARLPLIALISSRRYQRHRFLSMHAS